ncbi:MAG: hypothetical protein JWQ07_4050 [Ramlibacter sp.]|nr:hypothetical protein [Ramlibacter sp.]
MASSVLYPSSPAFDDAAALARPLIWRSGQELADVSARLSPAWTQWQSDWLPDERAASTAKVVCRLAHEDASSRAANWSLIGLGSGACAWVDAPQDGAARASEWLFQTEQTQRPSSDGVARSVAVKAWASLMDELRVVLDLKESPAAEQPESAIFKPWSGAIRVSLQNDCGHMLTLLLNAACVGKLVVAVARVASAPSVKGADLISLNQAIAQRGLTLKVQLAPCELDIGTLESLQVGDVVPLAHPLESPLRVSVNGAPVCAAYLGRRGEHKAIELVRTGATA